MNSFRAILFSAIVACALAVGNRPGRVPSGNPWSGDHENWQGDNSHGGAPWAHDGQGGAPWAHDGQGGSWGHGGSEPLPECSNIIPKNLKQAAQAPLIKTDITWDSDYNCEVGSKLRSVHSHQTTEAGVTCTGVTIATDDSQYDIVLGDNHHGGKRREKVTLTNYTYITSFNNGNQDYVECGIVANGHCAGDLWWGWGIYTADDKDGCGSSRGVAGATGILRHVQINGKCQSECLLGSSTVSYATAVNNQGATRSRTIEKSADSDSVESFVY